MGILKLDLSSLVPKAVMFLAWKPVCLVLAVDTSLIITTVGYYVLSAAVDEVLLNYPSAISTFRRVHHIVKYHQVEGVPHRGVS